MWAETHLAVTLVKPQGLAEVWPSCSLNAGCQLDQTFSLALAVLMDLA